MIYYIEYIWEGIVVEKFINYPKIEYVCEIPKDSCVKYKELCEWMYKNFKEDEKIAISNKLHYSYNAIKKIDKELKKLNEQKNDINIFLKLKDIEYIGNRVNFDEFIEDIMFEYQLFNKKNNYDYFNRVLSWYKIKQEFIESTIYFLSKNKLDLNEISFEQKFNEYSSEIIESEDWQGEMEYVNF